MPVAFEAELSREILRALNMAKEFNLDPVITGAREADQVVGDLKAQNARVIYILDYPTRSRALPPDADEPVRELRARAQAPKTPGLLAEGWRAVRLLVEGACSSRATSCATPRGR